MTTTRPRLGAAGFAGKAELARALQQFVQKVQAIIRRMEKLMALIFIKPPQLEQVD